MLRLPSLRLSWKLPLFVAGICLFISLGVGVPTFLTLQSTANHAAVDKLASAIVVRQQAMKNSLDTVGEWARFVAHNPDTIAALTGLQSGWKQVGGSARTYLQTAYATGNPFPLGERQNLARAPEPIPYNDAHGEFHPYFQQVHEHAELYDLFVINMSGDIIYSVAKEGDLGENLKTGPLSGSNLASVFAAASTGDGDSAYISDFVGYAPSNGAVSAFSAAAILDDSGQKIGVLAVQVNMENFASIIEDPLGLGETGVVYAVGSDMILRTGSRFEDGPHALADVSEVESVIEAFGRDVEKDGRAAGLSGQPSIYVSQAFEMGGIDWTIVAEQTEAEALANAHAIIYDFAIKAALVTALVTLVGWLYTRTVSNAIGRVRRDMSRIAEGKFDTEVADAHRGDEIGDVAKVLMNFRDKLSVADLADQEQARKQLEQQRLVTALSAGLVNLSEGNLTSPLTDSFAPEYEKLRQDFNKTLTTLNSAISDVIVAAGSIKHGALEISQASDDLSNRTENQAATLEETAAALDELTASVRSAAAGAKSVEQIVSEARTDAEQSGRVVQNAVAAMTEIEKSSEHISQIVGVIEDIAFQTNLLALNAGVEAARAGDAGKGFAVVASEVRALAQRSSEAAKEIKALIRGSSQQVERGVDLVGKAGNALEQIVQRVAHISSLMSDMATGANEQATGLNEINIGVNQLDQVTQQNAAMVEQATAASHNLNKDAERLTMLMERFRTDAGRGQDNNRQVAYRDPDRLKSGSDLSFGEVNVVPIAVNGRGGNHAVGAVWQDF